MTYSYEEAGRIIGSHPTTVESYAAELGAELDDDGLQAVWEAIEAANARATVDGQSETSADTSTQVRETTHAACNNEPAKSLKPIIIRRAEGEPTATAPHFSGSRGQAKFNAAGSGTDDKSRDRDRLIRPGESIADVEPRRARINALALRELDVEITVREAELATMKRARAVLARDVAADRSETIRPCGVKAV